ncbi:MAG TPA: IS110 family transposase [Candidatus Dormibacteraeota bacterium]
MYYVGLDVHESRSSIEILDCNGKLFKRTEVKGRWPLLIEELKKAPKPFAICYEASCGYGHLYEQFSKLAQEVKVAHPGALAWIFKSKRKHNRIDAIKLAKLLYLDEVPAVHVPSAAVRTWRQTIEFRQKLLRSRVMAKNQLRAFLRERGIAAPKSLWTRKSQAWLKTLELEEGEAIRRDLLQDQLEESDQKLKRVDKYLNKIAANHPGVTLLKTIPGVGPRTAEALVAYIDDARRFAGLKRAGAYFGLVPCQDASADKNRLGHITRDGPSTVRKLLCEAAWTGVRCSPTIRAYYQRLTHDDPDRKKIAIVAVAHHLVRVAVSMLKSGNCWQESVKEDSSSKTSCGGGENPSRPQGFSPPPATGVGAQQASPPPPLSASPFSPEGSEGQEGECHRPSRDGQTIETQETVDA